MKKKPSEYRTGNGRDCISHPDHGASIVMSGSTREWCPHVEHDGVYATKGRVGVLPTTPWLDKQGIEDADADAVSA